jgi:hypothetical protein
LLADTVRIASRRLETKCPWQNDSDQGNKFANHSPEFLPKGEEHLLREARGRLQPTKRSNRILDAAPRSRGRLGENDTAGGSYQVSGGALFRVDCRIARQTRSDVTGISK